MWEALREAEAAAAMGEVPVGAVIVRHGEIIARAGNRVEMDHDSSAHAELLAIHRAEQVLQAKWLTECELYVTLEPCAMCAGAMVLARLPKLVFGTTDPKNGACGSVLNVAQEAKLNHWIDVDCGILQSECSEILSRFFREMRQAKRCIRKQRNARREMIIQSTIQTEEIVDEEKEPGCRTDNAGSHAECGICIR